MIRVCGLRCGALVAMMLLGGCAFGDRKVEPSYGPVMSIRARMPQNVELREFTSTRQLKNESQIGQVRNAYGMVTAKVYCTGGSAAQWVRRALTDELQNAGFSVSDPAAAQAARSGVVVDGALNEFMTDVGMDGFTTRIRVKLTVMRNGVARLDKEFAVEDGGAGITGSKSEYGAAAQAALTKLMRRAVPEVIAAIEG